MDSKIGFEMSFFIVEAIRGRCASFMMLTTTVWDIFGGQTTLVLDKCSHHDDANMKQRCFINEDEES